MVINKELEKKYDRKINFGGFYSDVKNYWENRKMICLKYHLDPIC